jgi:2-oxoisovalerate dehydrogenase E1 component alpha subunit
MMLRSYRYSRTVGKFIINQINRCYQSVAVESNSSKISIYSGHIKGDITNRLEFIRPEKQIPIPIYQVLDSEGNIKDESQKPDFTDEHLVKMYQDMTLLTIMDRILYESQRQGRISFYMTNFGEEGTHIGSAAALNPKDLVYGQYREAGVLMYRGFKLHQFIDQCFGNANSSCKGIQMPVHYGSPELNFVTISSTMATQMPQAVGSAYAYKRAQNGLCVICYFGEGTASEGDAHAALNFAATLEVPVIFFCRNNGYAISTPTADQYRGDGIAGRGSGYGIATIRVDGNDLFGVYNVTKAARELAINEMRPVLIEAMTLRVGHHSTSDDSSAYRSLDEINTFDKKHNPITRFRTYMFKRGCWNEEKDEQWKQKSVKMVKEAFQKSESLKRAPISTMFENIFDKMEPHLKRQMKEMNDHIRQNHDNYPLSFHHDSSS